MEEDGADGYVEVQVDEDLTVVDKRTSPSSTLPHLQKSPNKRAFYDQCLRLVSNKSAT